jgi:hypothetical protein
MKGGRIKDGHQPGTDFLKPPATAHAATPLEAGQKEKTSLTPFIPG